MEEENKVIEVDFAKPAETPETKTEAQEEIVINVDSTKMKSIPLGENGKTEEPEETEDESEEDEPEETAPAENTENENDSDLPTKDELNKAKKELGIGGAAFVDELLAKCPNAFSRLHEAGKTLHGLFNFAYSLALKEYTAAHGRVNGGGWWDTENMLTKYLDSSVKEGFTYGEPKTKKSAPVKTDAKKVVEKVAKKAASDARKSAESKPKSKKDSAQSDFFGDLFA